MIDQDPTESRSLSFYVCCPANDLSTGQASWAISRTRFTIFMDGSIIEDFVDIRRFVPFHDHNQPTTHSHSINSFSTLTSNKLPQSLLLATSSQPE